MKWTRFVEGYGKGVRFIVYGMGAISACALLFIVAVVVIDVVGRIFGKGITGSFDFVRLLSTVVLGGALPYTTAVKGHIAIEFFFRRVGKKWRVFIDTISRLLMLILFISVIAVLIKHGFSLYASGEVTATVQLPIFWVPFWLALSFGVTSLVKIYHILQPGKELIKP
ncbi:MAG TPA: TRAP transporter small permease [Candidatus Hydrogenedens sp.]|nr:TRAP transporter small permease [Candidatus Hydrogenedens sp.]HOK09864.1 TRAP transporter small permease [Candidatus Hydrogenedens sp.]HOL19520.1 TRAP transporter small permease [Candidatus Hydrogenedens sp.]HPP59376.1 TRAP transporter small permease [Candidatus Hydrogenedens sp.]